MFSGSNQFIAILEMFPEFATLYGFTEQEIVKTYGPDLEKTFDIPLDQVLSKLKVKYNGYQIHPEQKER